MGPPEHTVRPSRFTLPTRTIQGHHDDRHAGFHHRAAIEKLIDNLGPTVPPVMLERFRTATREEIDAYESALAALQSPFLFIRRCVDMIKKGRDLDENTMDEIEDMAIVPGDQTTMSATKKAQLEDDAAPIKPGLVRPYELLSSNCVTCMRNADHGDLHIVGTKAQLVALRPHQMREQANHTAETKREAHMLLVQARARYKLNGGEEKLQLMRRAQNRVLHIQKQINALHKIADSEEARLERVIEYSDALEAIGAEG
ncbi:hypothetical protein K490DRAFT_60786 [Saccharata proteae CBS 121410]|uniref:Uncharacterized protein n=1 Tax=Saccharata proteae CBS 121410 TaxID=1314787 RepID=A0A9P4LZF7_9PEZI|nr:hypothetical protein K490DRAFT_60786 [Saccharata proteae CBS 121410]